MFLLHQRYIFYFNYKFKYANFNSNILCKYI